MKGHWINNQFTSGNSRNVVDVINPATEEILDSVPAGIEADVNLAVESSRQASDSWRRTPANERAALLHEVSARIRANWTQLVEVLTLEEGKPVPENEEEMEWVANTFDYYAELGRHVH